MLSVYHRSPVKPSRLEHLAGPDGSSEVWDSFFEVDLVSTGQIE